MPRPAMVVLHATDPATVYPRGAGADGLVLAGVARARAVRGADRPAHAGDAPHAVPRSAARRAMVHAAGSARGRRAGAAADTEDPRRWRPGPLPRRSLRRARGARARRHPRARRGLDDSQLRDIDPRLGRAGDDLRAASPTRGRWRWRRASSTTSRSTGGSAADGRAGRGSAASSAGARSSGGSRPGSRGSTSPRRRPSSCADGSTHSDPPPATTSAGGPAGRSGATRQALEAIGAVEV